MSTPSSVMAASRASQLPRKYSIRSVSFTAWSIGTFVSFIAANPFSVTLNVSSQCPPKVFERWEHTRWASGISVDVGVSNLSYTQGKSPHLVDVVEQLPKTSGI